jgi:peptidoglycan/LPS O-acetylase OafA/YrhL
MKDLPLNVNLSRSKRDPRFDIIKGICALGIVGVHFAGSFIGRPGLRWEPSFFLGVYWNQIFTFAVPVFIFISGFLNGRKEYPSTSNFYFRRLIGLLPQYFLVCIAWWILFPHASFIQDLTWDNIFIRLFYRGIQGTQYFVLAIMQLFLLAPVVRWLVAFMTEKVHKNSVFFIAALFLVLHIMIGYACFKGKLNYYYYCLPFSPFWLFYFFCGLYAQKLFGAIKKQVFLKFSLIFFLFGAIASQAYNLYRCSVPEIAGVETNLIPFDYAYSRPVMLVYDLFVVGFVALVLVDKEIVFPKILSLFKSFGKKSYEIYLWHLILLQYIGWGNPQVMKLCEEYPVVIVLVCVSTCIIIVLGRYAYDIILGLAKSVFEYSFKRCCKHSMKT